MISKRFANCFVSDYNQAHLIPPTPPRRSRLEVRRFHPSSHELPALKASTATPWPPAHLSVPEEEAAKQTFLPKQTGRDDAGEPDLNPRLPL